MLVLDLDSGVAGAFIDRPTPGAAAAVRQRCRAPTRQQLHAAPTSSGTCAWATARWWTAPRRRARSATATIRWRRRCRPTPCGRAAELLMPRQAVTTCGPRAGGRAPGAARRGWGTAPSRLRAPSASARRRAVMPSPPHGVETDEGPCCLAEIDAAIAEQAHVALAGRLGLGGVDDELARAPAVCRGCRRPCATPPSGTSSPAPSASSASPTASPGPWRTPPPCSRSLGIAELARVLPPATAFGDLVTGTIGRALRPPHRRRPGGRRRWVPRSR